MPEAGQIAVILSGGGCYGAYEVGVLLALVGGRSPSTGYRPLEPTIFTGTSVGAYNSAFLVSRWRHPADAAVKELQGIWRHRIADQHDGLGNGVYRFRFSPKLLDPRVLSRHPEQTLQDLLADATVAARGFVRSARYLGRWRRPLDERLVNLISLSALITTAPLRRTVHETIDFARLRASSRRLEIVATDWLSGQKVIVEQRQLGDRVGPRLVQGSASIPGLFPPQRVGPMELVDGSLVMNSPLGPAIGMGASELHLVQLFPSVAALPIRWKGSAIAALDRAQTSAWEFLLRAELRRIADSNHRLSVLARLHRFLATTEAGRQQISAILDICCEAGRGSPLAADRPLTVHCYRPRRPTRDTGPLSVLQFTRRQIESLIAQGYRDAVDHDCVLDGCLVPGSEAGAASASRWPSRVPA